MSEETMSDEIAKAINCASWEAGAAQKVRDHITAQSINLKLHKEALRWCLLSGAMSAMGEIWNDDGGKLEPPTHLSSVLAEAICND